MTLGDQYFHDCAKVVSLLDSGKEAEARDEVISILSNASVGQQYGELVNTLIRRSGLLPYIQEDSASWQDRFACEAFKVDGGADIPVTLHREQSWLLRRLLNGDSLAVSAPTSFGKSFVIDAFIAMRRPSVIVIVVPTIALADETRRRLQEKFGSEYKVVTTAGVKLAEKSILIFPAERAIGYIDALSIIDFLVVDEFYKADHQFDRERSPALLRAILRLSPRAKQRYFLAPNIKSMKPNEFTTGMTFVPLLDFRTVLLRIENAYLQIGNDARLKENYLLRLLNAAANDRTLIYAGSHAAVHSVGQILLEGYVGQGSRLLKLFSSWLVRHYGDHWSLPKLVSMGTGVHSGRLHRFLAQIQVHLFELQDGLKNIVSTSSIIEGVNTRAKNVVIWKSKNGKTNLNDFTYRNIIGRGGRAFKHFVGNIYLLDKPPPPEDTSLSLEMTDDVLSGEPERLGGSSVTREQIARIATYKAEMRLLLGAETYDEAILNGRFVSTRAELLRTVVHSVKSQEWNGIGFLNGDDPDRWDRFLYTALKLDAGAWDAPYKVVVNFTKALHHNWARPIPEILAMLGGRVGVDLFFSLERSVSFKLASILADVNTVNRMVHADAVDVSPFIAKLSSAFLPQIVFDLEEYGLPRMLARKFHQSRFIDFEDRGLALHDALEKLRLAGLAGIKRGVDNLTEFDEFLLQYFLTGIRSRPTVKG